MTELQAILESLPSARILVLGDIMLDRYTTGSVGRISPEAPIPVLQVDRKDLRPGGAASVASLLRGLGSEVLLAGVVGDDAPGQTVRRLLEEDRIDGRLVFVDPDRPTTVKERFVGRSEGRHPHQMLRVDDETKEPLGSRLEQEIAASVVERLARSDAVLISDYEKGCCTPALLALVIGEAASRGVPAIVDPARIPDYTRYRGATLVTPNRAEMELVSARRIATSEDACAAAQELLTRFGFQGVLVTLDRDGIALVRPGQSAQLFPTRPRAVYDVTGAGDMVLAVVGLCQAAGVPLEPTVGLANIAAGLEVERLGIVPVSRAEIREELTPPKPPVRFKRLTLDQLVVLAESYRREGRRLVLANGCFDLLHVGHVAHLEEAARLGDVLVVAVNSDASVRRLKGPERPVIDEQDRATLVAALECVDHVVIFNEDTPDSLLRRLRPDVLCKGGTYAAEEVVGRELVEAHSGRVCVTGRIPNVSTTRILSSLCQSAEV